MFEVEAGADEKQQIKFVWPNEDQMEFRYNTGAVERSEAARARRLAGATVVGPVTARADQLWRVARRNWSPGPNLAADQLLRERTTTVSKFKVQSSCCALFGITIKHAKLSIHLYIHITIHTHNYTAFKQKI